MSEKNIVTIGFEIACKNVKLRNFESKISLSDSDIIIFFPDISFYYQFADLTFKGEAALPDSYYSKLKELAEHWRREILNAFNSNKTIVIILNEIQRVYVDTGERKYSDTGSNSKVTRLFDSYSNYDAVPLKLRPVKSNGTSIKLARNSEMIYSYWKEFSDLSEYKVIIEEKLTGSLLLTEEDKVVGAFAKNKATNGSIILLPYLRFGRDASLGQQFLKSIIEIDKKLKNSKDDAKSAGIPSVDLSSVPNWVGDSAFDLPQELKIKKRLSTIDRKIDALHQEKEETKARMAHAGAFKKLLYEKEKALKHIIVECLKLLGFEFVKSGNSGIELPLVFQSEEGRCIGDVEGRDNEAIGFETLKQLELSVLEDYSHDEAVKMAKGVLFGNAYRLNPLNSRKEFFSKKCIIAAKRNRIALVRTPDLFWIIKYLSENQDGNYAKKCREVILQSEGEVVDFPKPPEIVSSLMDI